MADFQVTFTSAERDMLVRMLNDALRGKLVEERRTTYSTEYRHDLESEELLIQAMIDKLAVSETV